MNNSKKLKLNLALGKPKRAKSAASDMTKEAKSASSSMGATAKSGAKDFIMGAKSGAIKSTSDSSNKDKYDSVDEKGRYYKSSKKKYRDIMKRMK